MKHSLLKLTSLLMALMLLLTGCNLVKVDTAMQLDEDYAALQTAYAVPVAKYDGGEVTVLDVTYQYETNYLNLVYFYYMYYGTTEVDETFFNDMMVDVLETRVEMAIVAAHAEEMGVSLTEEELAQCRADAEAAWNENYEVYYTDYAEGETAEERALSTEYMLFRDGITEELIYEQAVEDLLYARVMEAIAATVEAPDEAALQAEYDARVAAAQETYTATPSQFESDVLTEGATIYWYPEGYRTVKHILLYPDDEVMAQYTEAVNEAADQQLILDSFYAEYDALADDDVEGARTAEEIMIDIQAGEAAVTAANEKVAAAELLVIASVQATIDEINTRLANGEDFDALCLEYSGDVAENSSEVNSYYVSADSTSLVEEFVEGAMSIETVGELSAPVVSSYGVHLIKYLSDVESGALPYDEVKAGLMADVLAELSTAKSEETVSAWVEAANVEYFYDNWTYTE